MSFGKDDTQETVQRSEPWGPAQGDLRNVLRGAGSLFNQGNSLLNSRSVDGLYGKTTDALGNILGGSGPLANLSATANGDFLNNNPNLHSMFSAMSGDVQDAVNSQFSSAGRTGSPAHAGVMTKELGNLGARIYGEDYARERQNQLNAGNQLGQFSLAGIGAAPGAYNFGNADLDALWQNLSRYGSLATGVGGMGGTQTGTTPNTGPSGLQQGLGAALSIASLFASDRDAKTDIEELSDDDALETLKSMPMYTYRYKEGTGDSGAEPRIGPMAQDWASSVGGDGKTIAMPQVLGTMLASLKAIGRKLDELEAA